MAVRKQDQLRTLQQLWNEQKNVKKACTVGVIIDSTCSHYDEGKKKFILKIKIVDDTHNTNTYSPHQKFPYLTVFFYSDRSDTLPGVRAIGDLIYLRRFSFGKYNQSFQAYQIEQEYCNWALVRGDTESTSPEDYQTSRPNMHLGDEKYQNLLGRIIELRSFARDYLSTNSVLSILPVGITPKDTDLIVKVVKKLQDGGYVLSKGKQELYLGPLVSFVQQNNYAKLRSVARITSHEGKSVVVPNNFTSLIRLPYQTHDVKKIQRSLNSMQEQAEIYTSLSELLTKPLSQVQNKKYFVNVEVAHVSPDKFLQALKFYDDKKNTVYDTQKKDTVPIYLMSLGCIDSSLSKSNKFAQIHIYSYDGKCNDFVTRVRLEDLNQFTNFSQESVYFNKRVEQLLNAESVRMTVQVLSDGKNNRMIRALHIA